MKKFKVHMNRLEYCLTKEIEADNADEAKDIYLEMFDNGDVEVNDSEIVELEAEEV